MKFNFWFCLSVFVVILTFSSCNGSTVAPLLPSDIKGRIFLEEGNTRLYVEGARVVLQEKGESLLKESQSDEKGNFVFEAMEKGEYSITVRLKRDGYIYEGEEEVGVDGSGDEVLVEILIRKTGIAAEQIKQAAHSGSF